MPYDPREINEALARLDRAERLDLAREEVAKRLAAQKPPEIPTKPIQQPTRSTMTAAQKSAFIRQHGPEKYNALPWTSDSS